jgi:hypothetical protein
MIPATGNTDARGDQQAGKQRLAHGNTLLR